MKRIVISLLPICHAGCYRYSLAEDAPTRPPSKGQPVFLSWIPNGSEDLYLNDLFVELVDDDDASLDSNMSQTGRRFLRGGSYSRGGGFSHSSYSSPSYHSSFSSPSYHSSSYSSPSHYSSSGYHGNYFRRGISDIIWFLLFFLCCPCCCVCACIGAVMNQNSNQEGQGLMNASSQHGNNYGSGGIDYSARNSTFSMEQRKFLDHVRKAKREVETVWSTNQIPPGHVPPHSGEYLTSYVDRTTQVQWNATLNLYFTPDFDGRGYKLSGTGKDVDGTTVIEDGHANYDGTSWWKERTVTGDLGLQVVSKGMFNFAQRTFQGKWLANSGEQAPYILFKAAEEASPPATTTTFTTEEAHPVPSAPPASWDDPSPELPMATATASTEADDDGIPTITASLVTPNQNR